MNFRCGQILDILNGELICGNEDIEISGVGIDSRKELNGQLFIPIVGENFNGHNFIEKAFINGANAALTQIDLDSSCLAKNNQKVVIKVKNTFEALGILASYYRKRFEIPVVGITGSVGKTSTKDMIYSIISKKYNTLKTEGNFNNEIGLPLTIFNMNSSHEAAVIEMGMSGFGEIRKLSKISLPSIAVITNIGYSHIEKLGSLENILKAKMEITEGMSFSEGVLILNGDDVLLRSAAKKLEYNCILYGKKDYNDYRAENIMDLGEDGTVFDVFINKRKHKINVRVPGVHNVYNALASIAVGCNLGMSMDDITEGICSYRSSKMRLNIIESCGIKIINDAYNASPASMEAALEVLSQISGVKRRIAVLGDMLELGEWAKDAHERIGAYTAFKNIDKLLVVGEFSKYVIDGAIKGGFSLSKTALFESNEDLNRYLKEFANDGDVFLVKGSRGMKMEVIVDYLKSINE
jgi:UDP-N-acetylmuramoyl-tripeptide--D-alanyl-D-alanine ligase